MQIKIIVYKIDFQHQNLESGACKRKLRLNYFGPFPYILTWED